MLHFVEPIEQPWEDESPTTPVCGSDSEEWSKHPLQTTCDKCKETNGWKQWNSFVTKALAGQSK